MEAAGWTTAEHCEQYCRHVKKCQAELQALWDACGLPSADRAGRMAAAANSAEAAWAEAVASAEGLRDALRERVAETCRRVAAIKEELADEAFVDAEAPPPCKSLQAELDAAEAALQLWQGRKAQRQKKYETLKEQCEQLRGQLGVRGSSVPVKTVTLFALDGLAQELVRLREEQAARQQRLDAQLKELRRLCLELGEDDGAHGAAVHASLADPRDAQSSCQDLSDATFEGLRHKALELQDLMRVREERGEALLGTLASLWGALDVPQDDVDRELFGRLMTGPSRLHKSAIDQCTAEVARLEGARKDVMLDIVHAKRQELASVCAAARMAVPAMPSTPGGPGEVSDLLARVLKQVSSARGEAAGRVEALACVAGLEAAQAEAAWLAQYEGDPNKYKGRDSTRNIQRAIQASEQRKQLPALVAAAEAALAAHRSREGRAFALEGRDYSAELAAVRLCLEAEEGQRAQAKAAGGPGSAKKGAPPKRVGPASSVLTPRRAAWGAPRASQDGGSARKPAVPPTPPAARRRTDSGAPRGASLLSRADSNASRVEAGWHASDDLSDRAHRLLQQLQGSQPVSRTASGASAGDPADRERAPATPEARGGKARPGGGEAQEQRVPNLRLPLGGL